jgi:8-oxo-dGTP diphosphatase
VPPLRVIAAAVVAGGRLLLVSKRAAPDVFYLPGGKPDPGEAAEACLRRELREELGVGARRLTFIADVRSRAALEPADMHMTVYGAQLDGEPRAAAEIAAVRWWPDGAPARLAPAVEHHVVPALRARGLLAAVVPDSLDVVPPRDPDTEALAEHLRQADLLDPDELRELIPSLLMLEGVALRASPPFDAEAIAGLRAANAELRDAADDPMAAVRADDEFHRRLTAGCSNAELLGVVDLVRHALVGYERKYLASPERLALSVDEHEAIVAALEAGDNALAAERVRENFTSGMPASTPRRKR